MAALRYAARKVSGRVLERPRVVVYSSFVSRPVEEEPRRLLPRVIHGGIPPSSCIRFRSTSCDPQNNSKHHSPLCKEPAATLESHSKNMDPAELELQIEHKKKELLRLLKMRLYVALRNKFTKEDQDLLCLLYKAQRTGTTKTIDANKREIQLMVGAAIFLAAVAVVQQSILLAG